MYKPKHFQIFGQKIKINYRKDMLGQGALGMYVHDSKRIDIQTHDVEGKEIDEDMLTQILRHEQTHCILSYLSLHELNMDEKFVDNFALCWHQIDKTMR